MTLQWSRKHAGWWEARGKQCSYRAVRDTSARWSLYIFDAFGKLAGEATSYPVTLEDCRYYAEQVETGRYIIAGGDLIRVRVAAEEGNR